MTIYDHYTCTYMYAINYSAHGDYSRTGEKKGIGGMKLAYDIAQKTLEWSWNPECRPNLGTYGQLVMTSVRAGIHRS